MVIHLGRVSLRDASRFIRRLSLPTGYETGWPGATRLWQGQEGIILTGWLAIIAMALLGIACLVAIATNDQALLEIVAPPFVLALAIGGVRVLWRRITGDAPDVRETLLLLFGLLLVVTFIAGIIKGDAGMTRVSGFLLLAAAGVWGIIRLVAYQLDRESTAVANRQDTEKERLVTQYARDLAAESQMSLPQAEKQVRDLVAEIEREMAQAGVPNRGAVDMANWLITNAPQLDPNTRAWLAAIRTEGVTDSDIQWWWRLPEKERRLIRRLREVSQMATFIHFKDKWSDGGRAATEMRRLLPIYGDPRDTRHVQGDDRPLPEELAKRVKQYLQRERLRDPSGPASRISHSSSLNALLRQEMRRGQLEPARHQPSAIR